MDFKGFAKNNKSKQNSEEDVKRIYEDTVKRSKGKSQAQLMDDILRQAAKDKSEGKLTDNDLQNFYNSVAPMLNSEQIKKLKEIMTMLNDK